MTSLLFIVAGELKKAPRGCLERNKYMNNNPFKELTDESAKSFIEQLHQQYLNRVNFYGIRGDDLNRFSWTGNKKLNLYIVQVYTDSTLTFNKHSKLLFFAVPSKELNNVLYFIDLKKNTENIDFVKTTKSDILLQLTWLTERKLLPANLKSNIIKSSLKFSFLPLNIFLTSDNEDTANEWADKEYEETLGKESHPTPVTPFPTSHQHYFVDRYHFDDMLKIINNDQFTDELNQCLFAYEHEKWFLCAAGLGSCVEHLMLIIIMNYANRGYKNLLSSLGKDPTARDYIASFRKEPIGIDTRQERFFNSIFSLRNAVDHHNTGKTQRGICDLLLNAMSDIYNDYYSQSMTIAPKKNGKSKKK